MARSYDMKPMNDIPALEATRAVAVAFLEHCFSGRMDAALELLAPDATWWVIGDPAKVKVSGPKDRPRIERMLANLRVVFPDGMQASIDAVTAEGERVAIEARSTAHTTNGLVYRNHYHFLLQVQGGRVAHLREYMDTQSVFEFQMAAAGQPPK
jgi:ketosteroid isomerase-like protein